MLRSIFRGSFFVLISFSFRTLADDKSAAKPKTTPTAKTTPAAKAAPPAPAAAENAPSVEDLLNAADRSRGAVAATAGITWQIDVQTFEDGSSSTVGYLVKAKGDDALAEAVSPPKSKGEMMLFNDRVLWFFKPGIKKPVSISPRQKLMGMAANGDIASTRYYRDYTGKLVGEEKIGDELAYKLDLKAKAKNVTYDGIRYWISKTTRLGIKAEFLTVSGDVFKYATFEYKNSMTLGGTTYPFVSKMTITDAQNKKNYTIINYNSPKPDKHADSLFNVNNLVR